MLDGSFLYHFFKPFILHDEFLESIFENWVFDLESGTKFLHIPEYDGVLPFVTDEAFVGDLPVL